LTDAARAVFQAFTRSSDREPTDCVRRGTHRDAKTLVTRAKNRFGRISHWGPYLSVPISGLLNADFGKFPWAIRKIKACQSK
jgi:hypothetical protein